MNLAAQADSRETRLFKRAVQDAVQRMVLRHAQIEALVPGVRLTCALRHPAPPPTDAAEIGDATPVPMRPGDRDDTALLHRAGYSPCPWLPVRLLASEAPNADWIWGWWSVATREWRTWPPLAAQEETSVWVREAPFGWARQWDARRGRWYWWNATTNQSEWGNEDFAAEPDFRPPSPPPQRPVEHRTATAPSVLLAPAVPPPARSERFVEPVPEPVAAPLLRAKAKALPSRAPMTPHPAPLPAATSSRSLPPLTAEEVERGIIRLFVPTLHDVPVKEEVDSESSESFEDEAADVTATGSAEVGPEAAAKRRDRSSGFLRPVSPERPPKRTRVPATGSAELHLPAAKAQAARLRAAAAARTGPYSALVSEPGRLVRPTRNAGLEARYRARVVAPPETRAAEVAAPAAPPLPLPGQVLSAGGGRRRHIFSTCTHLTVAKPDGDELRMTVCKRWNDARHGTCQLLPGQWDGIGMCQRGLHCCDLMLEDGQSCASPCHHRQTHLPDVHGPLLLLPDHLA